MSLGIHRAPTLVERVDPMLDEIRERAPETEAARQIPKDIVDRLIEAGYMSAMVPAERGGTDADLVDWLTATRNLARADMAVGWVAGLLSCHGNGVAHFEQRVQDEVWADGPNVLIGSSGAPVGRARRVPGGVRLSGRFPFSSGCDYCAWTMVGFVLEESDSRPSGFYQCLIPRSDYRIEDDWFISGLRGTGSKSILIDDVMVPEYRWFGPGLDMTSMSKGLYRNPMFNTAFVTIYNVPFAAIMLGGAEGALDAALAAVKARTVSAIGSHRTVSFAPRRTRLAESALDIRCAAAMIEKNWAWLTESFGDGTYQSPEEILWWRAEDSHAVRIARDAVDHLMKEGGGSAHLDNRPLQRFWRDIHVGCEHPWLDAPAANDLVSRDMLGLPLQDAEVL